MSWNDVRHSDRPSAPGWYAIHYCWEPREGSFIEVVQVEAEWPRLPIIQAAGPFGGKADAEEWTKSHDISF